MPGPLTRKPDLDAGPATSNAEALIGPIAAATTRIRVVSGGIMLPRYSPLSAAAQPAPRCGEPGHGAGRSRAVARDYQADELMVVKITHEHAARRRSYELLADAWNLAR